MVKDTKVTDDNFYLLTLAAIAKELKTRGIYNVDIFLSVGLPLTRFGAEKENFIKYLSRKKEVVFKFEQGTYRININKSICFSTVLCSSIRQAFTVWKKTYNC